MFHKLVFRKRPRKKVYLKTYLSNTPNTVDQIQIQIQIHGLKFDQIQIQIRRICICICKYKYVFDPSPDSNSNSFYSIPIPGIGIGINSNSNSGIDPSPGAYETLVKQLPGYLLSKEAFCHKIIFLLVYISFEVLLCLCKFKIQHSALVQLVVKWIDL